MFGRNRNRFMNNGGSYDLGRRARGGLQNLAQPQPNQNAYKHANQNAQFQQPMPNDDRMYAQVVPPGFSGGDMSQLDPNHSNYYGGGDNLTNWDSMNRGANERQGFTQAPQTPEQQRMQDEYAQRTRSGGLVSQLENLNPSGDYQRMSRNDYLRGGRGRRPRMPWMGNSGHTGSPWDRYNSYETDKYNSMVGKVRGQFPNQPFPGAPEPMSREDYLERGRLRRGFNRFNRFNRRFR